MWSKSLDLSNIELNEGEPPAKKLVTDGDLLIKELVKKQTNTKLNLNEQLSLKNDFQKATDFVPFTNYAAGTSSLKEFNTISQHVEEIDKLRNYGLAQDEIELYFDWKQGNDHLKSKYKNVNEEMVEEKLKVINKKIIELSKPEMTIKANCQSLETTLMLSAKPNSIETKLLKFAIENMKSSTKEKLPHPMDDIKNIEKEMFPIEINVNVKKIRKKARNLQCKIDSMKEENFLKPKVLKPKEIYSQAKHSKWDLEKHFVEKVETKKIYTCKPQNLYTIKNGEIIKLESNEKPETRTNNDIKIRKISLEEIRKIERFKNYEPGSPSKTLYLKNLSEKVTEEDLANIFCYGTIKLMKGRMRGQAFISFDTIENALEGFTQNNGFILKGKPIVIEYGKKSTDCDVK